MQLEKKIESSFKQMWENDSELKRGLDSCEFNLRAHQKVLNALAVDAERLYGDFTSRTGEGGQATRTMEISTEATEEAPSHTVRRTDWSYYHQEVQKDLTLLAEARRKEEAEKLEIERLAINESVARMRKELPAEALPVIASQISEGANLLKDAEGKELALSKAGRMLAVEALRAVPEVKEEMSPPQPADIPEGAAIFGG